MPRLIDADALREHWHISEKCKECHWNNRDCSKPPFYSLHDICEEIDEVPTIDAIPVEWLRKKRVTHPTTDAEILHNSVIRAVLVMWEREQEAR